LTAYSSGSVRHLSPSALALLHKSGKSQSTESPLLFSLPAIGKKLLNRVLPSGETRCCVISGEIATIAPKPTTSRRRLLLRTVYTLPLLIESFATAGALLLNYGNLP
jgi:hypothetical protein